METRNSENKVRIQRSAVSQSGYGSDDNAGQRSSRPLSLLAPVLLVESLVLLALVATQPEVSHDFAQRIGLYPERKVSERPRHDSTADPPTGAPAPDWRARALDGRIVSRADFLGKQVALLFIGRCSSCTLERARHWLQLQYSPSKHILVMVTTDTLDNAQWFSKQVGTRATVLQDTGSHMTRAYNAAWPLRSYVVDDNGILRYRQASEETGGKALRKVKELWGLPPVQPKLGQNHNRVAVHTSLQARSGNQ